MIRSGVSPSSERKVASMRSSAQKRLTAVGREVARKALAFEEFREDPWIIHRPAIPDGEVGAVRRGYPNRGSPSHPELVDRFPNFLLSLELKKDEIVGQSGLIENDKDAMFVIQADGIDASVSPWGFPLFFPGQKGLSRPAVGDETVDDAAGEGPTR